MTQTWIISTCLCVTCIDITNSTLSSSFRYHESSQMSSLVETFISKASALQRQGRAGRVRNGFCFRLYPKYRYEAHRPLMQRAGWNQVQKARNTSLYHLIKNAVSRKDSKQNLSSFRSCANLLCSFFFFFFKHPPKFRFDIFMDYSIPEILRVPLEELCLHIMVSTPFWFTQKQKFPHREITWLLFLLSGRNVSTAPRRTFWAAPWMLLSPSRSAML